VNKDQNVAPVIVRQTSDDQLRRVIVPAESCAEFNHTPTEKNVMREGHSTRDTESEAIAKSGMNGSTSIEATELADELGPIPSFPPLALDPATGRVLPVTDEEMVARRDAAVRMLAALERLTDESDTDENWREVYRNIDSCRPHRPLFEGLY
jgi:hypothetical protein